MRHYKSLDTLTRIAAHVVVLVSLGVRPVTGIDLNAGALGLVNSEAADYANFPRFIKPYLIQFGVPYEVRDLAQEGLGKDVAGHALVIIGHRGLDVPRRFCTRENEQPSLSAVQSGTGLVSFDGLLAAWAEGQPFPLCSYAQEIFGLTFRTSEETVILAVGASATEPAVVLAADRITALGDLPRPVKPKRRVAVPGTVPGNQGRVLAFAGRQPLLVSSNYGKGCTFASLLPAVLFTHESDHIQHMAPHEWDRILKGVQAGLEPYRPIAVTPDFLSQYLRALRTSRLLKARYDASSRLGILELEGRSDAATKFDVFDLRAEVPVAREWEAPPCRGKLSVAWRG